MQILAKILNNNTIILLLLLAAASYLFGNINFALIISKLKKSDVRKVGSGNPGTLNMSRNFGLKIGLITFALDIIKGGLPSLIGFLIFKGRYVNGFHLADLARYICGLSVIIGHIYPVFMKFKGGKGIASTIGVFLFSNPLIALALLFATFIFMYTTEMGSLSSLIAVSSLATMQLIIFYKKYAAILSFGLVPVLFSLILGICFLTFFAHRQNIIKMLCGTEHKTSIRKLSKKM